MTAYRPAFQVYDTAPITLADHPLPSTSRSHYHNPRPSSPPHVQLERHPRSVIQPVQISTEFLLKPQSQSHSGLAPHFLNFAALRGKAEVSSSQAKFDKSEGDSITLPQDLDPWLTTNSVNVRDGQIHETSTGDIDEYPRSGTGVYVSPALNPPAISPPLMPLPPHPEFIYGNRFINPPPLALAAHQPVPPEQHSRYSELQPHLEFMEKLQQQALAGQPVDVSPRKVRRLSPKTRDARQSTYPSPIERSRRPEHRSGSLKVRGRDQTRFTPPPSEREPGRESSESSEVGSTGSTSSRNHKEPKRPSLACTFCRERKIACDRWAEGGIDSDAPCTACALRSFDCVFVHKTSNVQRTSKANQPKRP